MRRFSLLVLALFLISGTAASRADTLLAYWDLNSTLAPSIPTTASLITTLEGSLLDRQSYGLQGSTLNLPSGFDSGQSRRFFDLASLVSFEGTVEITGINLVGLSLPTLSFAIRKSDAAELFDYFRVEIDTGDGWTFYKNLAEPTEQYGVRSVTIETPLPPDLTHFGMRIVFGARFDVVDIVEVDNVQVNAVPEPSAVLLLALGALIASAAALRRRQPAR